MAVEKRRVLDLTGLRSSCLIGVQRSCESRMWKEARNTCQPQTRPPGHTPLYHPHETSVPWPEQSLYGPLQPIPKHYVPQFSELG